MIKQDLCNAMTEQQAKTFAGTFLGTKVDSSPTGPAACVWEYEGERYLLGDVVVWIGRGYDKGLTTLYAEEDSASWSIKPIDAIHGYPAVIQNLGMQSIGSCVVAVGVQNDLVYMASAILEDGHPHSDNPCTVAKKLAGYVIQNLKKNQ